MGLSTEKVAKREYINMFRYIEIFYIRKCRHSYLGYISPIKNRMRYEADNIA